MIFSYSTLLPIDNSHRVAVDIGITIKLNPVRDSVIHPDVVAKISKVSNDFSIVVIVLNKLYFYFDLLFLSLKYVNISLLLLMCLLKLLTTFNSFSNL